MERRGSLRRRRSRKVSLLTPVRWRSRTAGDSRFVRRVQLCFVRGHVCQVKSQPAGGDKEKWDEKGFNVIDSERVVQLNPLRRVIESPAGSARGNSLSPGRHDFRVLGYNPSSPDPPLVKSDPLASRGLRP